MPKMIGAHAPNVAPGGFKKKRPVRENMMDVREGARAFWNKRIKVKSEWSANFPKP
jgi:hypothetical protein